MIFGFCFSKNLKIHIVFFQMIHYFEHYFSIYISTSMDQILWNAPILNIIIKACNCFLISILKDIDLWFDSDSDFKQI